MPSGTVDPLEPTIFHESWWLELATDNRYAVAEVTTGAGVVGRLPYQVNTRNGLRFCEMPPITHFLGPAIDEGKGSSNTRMLKRLAITRELIEKIPAVSSIYVKCHRGVTDTIAFQDRGFHTSVQFTHEVLPDTIDNLWKNMRDKTRNVIRRAQEKLLVKTSCDPAEFIRFYLSSLNGKQINSYIDFQIGQKLITASLVRGRGKIFSATNSSGALVAAIFCVWDSGSYYYLMSTRSPDAGNGAISLLLWEAIKDAARRGLIFDLDGLANSGSILLYAGFGATICPRYIVTWKSPKYRLLSVPLNFLCKPYRNNFL
jgi:hypothetical protein